MPSQNDLGVFPPETRLDDLEKLNRIDEISEIILPDNAFPDYAVMNAYNVAGTLPNLEKLTEIKQSVLAGIIFDGPFPKLKNLKETGWSFMFFHGTPTFHLGEFPEMENLQTWGDDSLNGYIFSGKFPQLDNLERINGYSAFSNSLFIGEFPDLPKLEIGPTNVESIFANSQFTNGEKFFKDKGYAGPDINFARSYQVGGEFKEVDELINENNLGAAKEKLEGTEGSEGWKTKYSKEEEYLKGNTEKNIFLPRAPVERYFAHKIAIKELKGFESKEERINKYLEEEEKILLDGPETEEMSQLMIDDLLEYLEDESGLSKDEIELAKAKKKANEFIDGLEYLDEKEENGFTARVDAGEDKGTVNKVVEDAKAQNAANKEDQDRQNSFNLKAVAKNIGQTTADIESTLTGDLEGISKVKFVAFDGEEELASVIANVEGKKATGNIKLKGLKANTKYKLKVRAYVEEVDGNLEDENEVDENLEDENLVDENEEDGEADEVLAASPKEEAPAGASPSSFKIASRSLASIASKGEVTDEDNKNEKNSKYKKGDLLGVAKVELEKTASLETEVEFTTKRKSGGGSSGGGGGGGGGSSSSNEGRDWEDRDSKKENEEKKEDKEQKPVIEVKTKLPKDVAENHWAKNDILFFINKSCLVGYPDGTFRPEQNITRAEFASVIVCAFELEKRTGKKFADTENHWAREKIETANAHGVLVGYNDEEFGPNDKITREQISAMLVNTLKLPEIKANKNFKDIDNVSAWARGAVETAITNSLISGYEDQTIKPLNYATRAEAVSFIYKALSKNIK